MSPSRTRARSVAVDSSGGAPGGSGPEPRPSGPVGFAAGEAARVTGRTLDPGRIVGDIRALLEESGGIRHGRRGGGRGRTLAPATCAASVRKSGGVGRTLVSPPCAV